MAKDSLKDSPSVMFPAYTTSRLERRGVMLVISSPSGAGKSALSRLLLQAEPDVRLSISVTTRARRPSEVDGQHYHFISVETFEAMRARGDLLEWAEVHGNFYATPRKPVDAALTEGRDVLFDIDVKGTLQLYETMRADVVSVFILPPSIAELNRRLHRRAEDAEEVILRRLRTARSEMAHWQDYDYILMNDDIDRCFSELRAILAVERLKRERNPHLAGVIDTLQQDLAAMLDSSSPG
jgi:guanylate kinase